MNEPLVSVVMVVCNADRFLDEAIESILQQTFTEFEFIVVDYGSTDSTKDIVERYAGKDARVRMKAIPYCGLGDARNVACSLARGRYIGTMDADDVSLPDRLTPRSRLHGKVSESSPIGLRGSMDQRRRVPPFMLVASPRATENCGRPGSSVLLSAAYCSRP